MSDANLFDEGNQIQSLFKLKTLVPLFGLGFNGKEEFELIEKVLKESL